MQTAGIIGGAGFIGSYVTKLFLENGFRVKVSATDISNREKYAHLHGLPHAENIQIAPLDVQDLAQLQAFAADCDILVHGGTPFQLDVADPQRDLFDPTVRGTEHFLRVVSETPSVKKVVFIASVASYNTDFPMAPPGHTEGLLISENEPPHFSAESHPYAQAKFLANQAVKRQVEKDLAPRVEIVTVSPVFVVGQQLSGREDSTSTGMQFLFKNKIAPNPFVQMLYDNDVLFAMVAVEDVAQAIFNAATGSGGHGKNYLLSSESYRVSDISRMLNGEVPSRQPAVVYSNALSTEELGLTYRPIAATLNGA